MNSISINDDNSINDNHNSDSDKPKPPRPTPDAAETPTDLSTRIAFASENSPRTEPIPADPGGLYARLKDDPKFTIRTLDAGPERVVVVLARALQATLASEMYDEPAKRKSYPTLVVRERPGAEAGKPDNESIWPEIGVYRHVQILDGGTFEFVEKDARLTRETGGKASIVMRTAGAVRVFEHADDQKIPEGSYIPC